LKNALVTPPVLAMPTDSDEFILDADSSDYAIGAVLSQRQQGCERVIAYASRTLDRREQNYCITRKELLSVVYSLRLFKQYLLGRTFRVRTEHAALSWLRRTPDPIGQQARWLEQMEEYDFVIEHRPGKHHGNADALSRRICPKKDCICRRRNSDGDTIPTFGGPADRQTTSASLLLSQSPNCIDGADSAEISSTPPLFTRESTEAYSTREEISSDRVTFEEQNVLHVRSIDRKRNRHNVQEVGLSNDDIMPWSMEGLRAAQRQDKDIGFIVQLCEQSSEKPQWENVSLQSAITKTLWNQWPRLCIRDGLLKRRFESADGTRLHWQIVWPKNLTDELMRIAHGGMTGGHLSRRRTASCIQSRAYWPTWSSDLDDFLKKCETCSRFHRGVVRRQGPMQIALTGEPWERVSVDITGPHPRSSRGKKFILTVVDHFSKWAEAIPLASHTAPVMAQALMNHVFSRFGAPLQLLTDRGAEFESQLFNELMHWMKIDKLRTTAYKPSTNGVVERFHRTLNSMLGKAVSESQRDWDLQLPLVLAAYRASPHSSTGYSPNRLFLGREARMPLDLLMGSPRDESAIPTVLSDYVQRMKSDAERCYELARNHLRVAAERRKTDYDIRVKRVDFDVGAWVWYWYPRRYRNKYPKWQSNYVGPYLVVRKIPPVNYVIQKSSKAKPIVVHADKLKKCYGETPSSWLPGEIPILPADTTVTPDLMTKSEVNPVSIQIPQTVAHEPVIQSQDDLAIISNQNRDELNKFTRSRRHNRRRYINNYCF
jgi:transposase InsO family protein